MAEKGCALSFLPCGAPKGGSPSLTEAGSRGKGCCHRAPGVLPWERILGGDEHGDSERLGDPAEKEHLALGDPDCL